MRGQGGQHGAHAVGPAFGGGAGEQAGREAQRGVDAAGADVQAQDQVADGRRRGGGAEFQAGRQGGGGIDADGGGGDSGGGGVAQRGVEPARQVARRRRAAQVDAHGPHGRGAAGRRCVLADADEKVVQSTQARQHDAPGGRADRPDAAAPRSRQGLDRLDLGRRQAEAHGVGRRGRGAVRRAGEVGRQFQPAGVPDIRRAIGRRGDRVFGSLDFHDVFLCRAIPESQAVRCTFAGEGNSSVAIGCQSLLDRICNYDSAVRILCTDRSVP